MVRMLAQIWFEAAEGLFWWPFFIDSQSEEDAREFFERNLSAIRERYSIEKIEVTRATSINEGILRELRNRAFQGHPFFLDVKSWILADGIDRIETDHLLNFNENIDFKIWETGRLSADQVGHNRFPVRLIRSVDWHRDDDHVQLVVNLVK